MEIINPHRETTLFRHNIHGIRFFEVFLSMDIPEGEEVSLRNSLGKTDTKVTLIRIIN
jgi:hypothetical protein